MAQEKYESKKENCGRKRIGDKAILEYIKDKLACHWSPEQIYHRKIDAIQALLHLLFIE